MMLTSMADYRNDSGTELQRLQRRHVEWKLRTLQSLWACTKLQTYAATWPTRLDDAQLRPETREDCHYRHQAKPRHHDHRDTLTRTLNQQRAELTGKDVQGLLDYRTGGNILTQLTSGSR